VLERRGHRFVRYADDIRIYVGSRRGGQRVMESTCSFIERPLKLHVNRGKSSVGAGSRVTLLGFGFLRRGGEIKVRIDPQARKPAKDRLRRLTSRRWGVSMQRRIRELNRFTVGWTAYFALADTPRPFADSILGAPPATASALEGMEALPDQAAQPPGAGHT
jgi:RNA-directed DNA polymerase